MTSETKSVERICRHCFVHLGGKVAATHARWEVCMACEVDPLHDLPLLRWMRVRWSRRRRAKELANERRATPTPTGEEADDG